MNIVPPTSCAMAPFIRYPTPSPARRAPLLAWVAVGLVGLASMGWLAPEQVEAGAPTPLAKAGSESLPEPPAPPHRPNAGKTLTIAENRFHRWGWRDDDSGSFKVGEAQWTGRRGPEGDLKIILEAPGQGAREFVFDTEWGVSVAIGRLDMARPGPQLMVLHYSGGMHCCTMLDIVSPEGRGWRREQIGGWEQLGLDEGLVDHDGDGWPDFEVTDDRFYYAFASYSGSYVPTRMVQVRDGKLVDVSRRPAFRKHFEQQMAEHRKVCEAERSNSACAAFVANASRLGRFAWAWQVMLKSYDRTSGRGVSFECDPRGRLSYCLAEGEVSYPGFPAALRAKLRETGYLSKG